MMPQHCRILFSQHPCICLRLPSSVAAEQASSKPHAGLLDDQCLPQEAAGLCELHSTPAPKQLSVTFLTTAAGQVSSKAPAGPLDNGLPHEAAGALRIHTMAEASAATPLAPTAADATTAASGRGKLVQGKQSKDPEVKVRALMFCLRQARLGNRRQDGVGSAPLKAARSCRPKEIHIRRADFLDCFTS